MSTQPEEAYDGAIAKREANYPEREANCRATREAGTPSYRGTWPRRSTGGRLAGTIAQRHCRWSRLGQDNARDADALRQCDRGPACALHHAAGRDVVEDAPVPAAVQFLRSDSCRETRAFSQPERGGSARGSGSRAGSYQRGGRPTPPGGRGGGLLSFLDTRSRR